MLSSVACLAIQNFPRYFTKGTILEKKIIKYEINILLFSTNVV